MFHRDDAFRAMRIALGVEKLSAHKNEFTISWHFGNIPIVLLDTWFKKHVPVILWYHFLIVDKFVTKPQPRCSFLPLFQGFSRHKPPRQQFDLVHLDSCVSLVVERQNILGDVLPFARTVKIRVDGKRDLRGMHALSSKSPKCPKASGDDSEALNNFGDRFPSLGGGPVHCIPPPHLYDKEHYHIFAEWPPARPAEARVQSRWDDPSLRVKSPKVGAATRLPLQRPHGAEALTPVQHPSRRLARGPCHSALWSAAGSVKS
jgi:hypothetical protein